MKITVSPPVDWEMLMLVAGFFVFVALVMYSEGQNAAMNAQDVATKQDRARIMHQYVANEGTK